MTQVQEPAASGATAIRPFKMPKVSDEELAELRRRIKATRWPTRELVPDQSQGIQLATTQALAAYWASDYDWRKCEAKLNAIPQFVTEIDGQDIQFMHVRSKHENALPLIVTHGWPGSIIEQTKIIEPLTNPTAHGASASDAFDLVIPSMPGYGYSPEPATLGWDPVRIAKAWVVLMQRLGYPNFVAQGGDWGAAVTQELALLAPAQVLAIHSNMPGTVPADILSGRQSGPACAGRPFRRRVRAFEQLKDFYAHHLGYAVEMSNRPQTLYALMDSPVGLAAWILDHDKDSYEMIAPAFAGKPGGLSRDDVLDNITMYWLTGTAISSARLSGRISSIFSTSKASRFRRASAPFHTSYIARRGAGRRKRIQSWFITSSTTSVATSQRWSSRSSSAKTCERLSDRCEPADRLKCTRRGASTKGRVRFRCDPAVRGQPLVHAPQSVESASVRGVGVIDAPSLARRR